MKHFIIVLTVALITLSIIFAIYQPNILEDVWLWIIGLIGPIIGFLREIIKSLNKFFKELDLNE